MIISVPIKNQQACSIKDAWDNCYNKLRYNGYAPTIHIMDNKCSNNLKTSFFKYNISFQHVPPHNHIRNAVKRAIQTCKKYFIAGLSTCEPHFPLT